MNTNNLFKNNLPFSIILIETIKYKKKIENTFYSTFYKNEKYNSYRNFYHVPPKKNVKKFVNYLYPSLHNCKDTSKLCKPYNDIRIYRSLDEQK